MLIQDGVIYNIIKGNLHTQICTCGPNFAGFEKGMVIIMEIYRSPYEAYPFLSDISEDLRCDFEIMTDKIACLTGLLRSKCGEASLRDELEKIDTLVYHLNPSLRTRLTVTREELEWLLQCTNRWKAETAGRCEKFVLPQGSERSCLAHILRTECKALVRLIYRYVHRGSEIDPLILDFSNLLSNYFFVLSLKLNKLDGVEEIPFESRNYK